MWLWNNTIFAHTSITSHPFIDFPSNLHRIFIEFASSLQRRKSGGTAEEQRRNSGVALGSHWSHTGAALEYLFCFNRHFFTFYTALQYTLIYELSIKIVNLHLLPRKPDVQRLSRGEGWSKNLHPTFTFIILCILKC